MALLKNTGFSGPKQKLSLVFIGFGDVGYGRGF